VVAVALDHRAGVVAGAALAGAATPPLEPCLRALWPDVVDAGKLESAYALDSASQSFAPSSTLLRCRGTIPWPGSIKTPPPAISWTERRRTNKQDSEPGRPLPSWFVPWI
jgi:hypothetical protein